MENLENLEEEIDKRKHCKNPFHQKYVGFTMSDFEGDSLHRSMHVSIRSEIISQMSKKLLKDVDNATNKIPKNDNGRGRRRKKNVPENDTFIEDDSRSSELSAENTSFSGFRRFQEFDTIVYSSSDIFGEDHDVKRSRRIDSTFEVGSIDFPVNKEKSFLLKKLDPKTSTVIIGEHPDDWEDFDVTDDEKKNFQNLMETEFELLDETKLQEYIISEVIIEEERTETPVNNDDEEEPIRPEGITYADGGDDLVFDGNDDDNDGDGEDGDLGEKMRDLDEIEERQREKADERRKEKLENSLVLVTLDGEKASAKPSKEKKKKDHKPFEPVLFNLIDEEPKIERKETKGKRKMRPLKLKNNPQENLLSFKKKKKLKVAEKELLPSQQHYKNFDRLKPKSINFDMSLSFPKLNLVQLKDKVTESYGKYSTSTTIYETKRVHSDSDDESDDDDQAMDDEDDFDDGGDLVNVPSDEERDRSPESVRLHKTPESESKRDGLGADKTSASVRHLNKKRKVINSFFEASRDLLKPRFSITKISSMLKKQIKSNVRNKYNDIERNLVQKAANPRRIFMALLHTAHDENTRGDGKLTLSKTERDGVEIVMLE